MDQDWREKLATVKKEKREVLSKIEVSEYGNKLATAFSIILIVSLVYFVFAIAIPIISEDPSEITPDGETYSDSQFIGVGDVDEGYEVEEPTSSDYVYQEQLEYDCSPSGERISTGGSLDCDYRAIALDGNEPQGLVKFDREILDNIGHRTIIAEWTRLSPEGETSYVIHHHGSSVENTLNGTFRAYTPAEAGQYEFRLLLNSKLNPHGNPVNNSDVISSSGTELYVYSEEQSASFTTSEAFYQLERIAVIGITIAWLQLILSFYKIGRK